MRPNRALTIARAAARGLILTAAAMSLWAAILPARADEMGTSMGGSHPHSPMMPHFAPGIVPPLGPGTMPPSGSGMVPPLGPGIVPPLVPGPCCQGGFDHGRRHRFPFLGFGVVTTTNPSPAAEGQTATAAASANLPPPPADFEPRLVTLKPSAAMPGDPTSVVILRPGRPDEVVRLGGTRTP